jgi:anti-anti-sigma factor
MARTADIAWFFTFDHTELPTGVVVVRASGRLGKAAAGRLDRIIETLIASGKSRAILDLAGVDYINSAGVLALQNGAARMRSAGGSLSAIGLQDPVKLVLDLAGPIEHLGFPESDGHPGRPE